MRKKDTFLSIEDSGENKEKYRILFDSMNEGYSICDVVYGGSDMAEKYGTIISIAKILVVINMKKLQLISLIMLALSISGMAVNHFRPAFPTGRYA